MIKIYNLLLSIYGYNLEDIAMMALVSFLFFMVVLSHLYVSISKNTLHISSQETQYEKSIKGQLLEIMKGRSLGLILMGLSLCLAHSLLIVNFSSYNVIQSFFVSLILWPFSIIFLLMISLKFSHNKTYISKDVLYGIYDGDTRTVTISEIDSLEAEGDRVIIQDKYGDELVFWTKEPEKLTRDILSKKI